MTQPAIAEAIVVSLSTVNRAHMAYDQGGIKALKPKPCGGRQRQNMTIAAEQSLLARFAKAGGAGEMLHIHDLQSAYERTMAKRRASSLSCASAFSTTSPSWLFSVPAACHGNSNSILCGDGSSFV